MADEQEQNNVDASIVNNKIFVVHGHDGLLKQKIARYLEKLDLALLF